MTFSSSLPPLVASLFFSLQPSGQLSFEELSFEEMAFNGSAITGLGAPGHERTVNRVPTQ